MIKIILFSTFITIFCASAIVTLLGICEIIKIETKFLNKLFTALLLELIASVILLFGTTLLNISENSEPWTVNGTGITIEGKNDNFDKYGYVKVAFYPEEEIVNNSFEMKVIGEKNSVGMKFPILNFFHKNIKTEKIKISGPLKNKIMNNCTIEYDTDNKIVYIKDLKLSTIKKDGNGTATENKQGGK